MSDAESCYGVFNHNSAFIDCKVAVSIPLSQAFSVDDTEDCILAEHSSSFLTLARSPSRRFSDQAKGADVEQQYRSVATQLRRRNPAGPPSPIRNLESTVLVGNRKSHQNALDKQLSSLITCDQDAVCSAGQQNSLSYNKGFTVSATVEEWLIGGFDVSASITTGDSYTCNGTPGDMVCNWQNEALTAYTVQDWGWKFCGATDPKDIVYGDDVILQSRNKNNDGGGYYCVVSTCRN